jgi:hypothetical protein
MPAEHAQPERPDPLTVLGLVTPPMLEVLAAARGRLWSAVAEQMLVMRPDASAAEASDASQQGRGERGRGA